MCLWLLLHTCFAQIARPSAARFISVFDNDGNEVLSINVSTTTAVIYSGDMLAITPSTSFFTNRTYYLLADSGVCACACEVGMCSCEQAGGQADVCIYLHAYMCACMRANLSCLPLPLYTPKLYLQVLLLL